MINFPNLENKHIFGDDIISFNLKLESEEKFLTIENEFIANSILNRYKNNVDIITRVSCNATFYEKVSNDLKISVPLNELFGRVSIVGEIVIKDDLNLEIVNALDAFYNDTYSLTKGQIIFRKKAVSVNVLEEKVVNDHIVDLRLIENQRKVIMIKLNRDKILITLNNKKYFYLFKRILKINENLFFTLIPLPVILAGLSDKKEIDDYRNRVWYQLIENQAIETNLSQLEEIESNDIFMDLYSEEFIIDKLIEGLNKILKS